MEYYPPFQQSTSLEFGTLEKKDQEYYVGTNIVENIEVYIMI